MICHRQTLRPDWYMVDPGWTMLLILHMQYVRECYRMMTHVICGVIYLNENRFTWKTNYFSRSTFFLAHHRFHPVHHLLGDIWETTIVMSCSYDSYNEQNAMVPILMCTCISRIT